MQEELGEAREKAVADLAAAEASRAALANQVTASQVQTALCRALFQCCTSNVRLCSAYPSAFFRSQN